MDMKDAATQTDWADQARDQATQVGALSPDSFCNHTFTEAIDFIISATSEPEVEVLEQPEGEVLEQPEVEFLEQLSVEVLG